jgi:hypothetical protein
MNQASKGPSARSRLFVGSRLTGSEDRALIDRGLYNEPVDLDDQADFRTRTTKAADLSLCFDAATNA